MSNSHYIKLKYIDYVSAAPFVDRHQHSHTIYIWMECCVSDSSFPTLQDIRPQLWSYMFTINFLILWRHPKQYVHEMVHFNWHNYNWTRCSLCGYSSLDKTFVWKIHRLRFIVCGSKETVVLCVCFFNQFEIHENNGLAATGSSAVAIFHEWRAENALTDEPECAQSLDFNTPSNSQAHSVLLHTSGMMR